VSIVVIGVNHRTGPLSLLERVAVSDDALPKVLHGLVSRPNISEAVVLSTCNRTEVYAVAEKFHGAYADIRDFFCEIGHMQPDDLHPHLYSQHDEAAVAHLFGVASGLESAVLGETEILGQVRDAWERAQAEGSARSSLNLLFRHAVETGKRARTETDISRHTASVSQAAVEMTIERLGSLADCHVLVVGTGEMGGGIAQALSRRGTRSITVTNRTRRRAEDLAIRIDATVLPFSEMPRALADADVVLTCTGSGEVLIDITMMESALTGRGDRPMLIADIAVPRDVDGAVAGLPGVTLLDLDDLRDWASRGLNQRAGEAQQVRSIVSDEVERYLMESLARQAAPLVAQMRERADAVRRSELDRFAKRLAMLEPAEREAVDALTKAIVAKLLHEPSVRLKDEAGTPRGERNASAVRDLFDLS
jgi:glutamyl-tRNA reductase